MIKKIGIPTVKNKPINPTKNVIRLSNTSSVIGAKSFMPRKDTPNIADKNTMSANKQPKKTNAETTFRNPLVINNKTVPILPTIFESLIGLLKASVAQPTVSRTSFSMFSSVTGSPFICSLSAVVTASGITNQNTKYTNTGVPNPAKNESTKIILAQIGSVIPKY